MVQLGIGQDDPFDGNVAYPGSPGWQAGELGMDIGRGIQQEPALSVRTHRGRGLRPWQGTAWLSPRHTTGGAPAVPLGEAAAGGGAEEDDLHLKTLRGSLSRA